MRGGGVESSRSRVSALVAGSGSWSVSKHVMCGVVWRIKG